MSRNEKRRGRVSCVWNLYINGTFTSTKITSRPVLTIQMLMPRLLASSWNFRVYSPVGSIVLLGQSLPGLWSLKRKGERHFTWKFNCPFPLLLLLFRTDEQRYIAGKVAFFFKSLKETAAFLPSRHFRSVIDFCVNYFGTERLARLHGKLPSTHIISIHTRIVRISK